MHLSKLEQSGIQDLQELHSSTPEIVRKNKLYPPLDNVWLKHKKHAVTK